ncbi:MAG TPA: peptide ABC transporter ATP-binding protein [Treponema sp.]|nr:peptide ABC transporter ATP-binding protein [Treponema sp.]
MSESINAGNVALSVRNLTVSFRTNKGIVHAVRGISFDLKKGETLALVGESGSGKSVTAKAMLGIEAPNAIIESGSIFYENRDLLKFTEEDFNQIRGNKITMIFQDPMSSLDPIVKIGPQMTEAAILNGRRKQKLAEKKLCLIIKNLSKNDSYKKELAGIKKAVKLAKKDYSIQFKNLSLAYDFEEAKLQVKIPECLSPAKNLLLQKEFEELNDALCRSTFCVTKKMAYEKALKIMAEVGISDGEKRFNQYPFEFSGGMRQRIVIAIAIAANPDLLICDEPTTALDVTIQAQILELINSLKKKRGMSVIFITHDLGVVANVADRIAVMYAGKIVETGSVDDVFYSPAHPYTWALLGSMPDLDSSGRLEAIPGTPPNMIYPPEGDAFAARNKYAMQIDFEREPPLFKISESHSAATWLLHPNAPKVELPETLAKRIARMKERRNADGGKR